MKKDLFHSTEVDKFRSSVIERAMTDICASAVSLVVASNASTKEEVDIVVDGICSSIRNKVYYVAPEPSTKNNSGKDTKEN